MGPVRIPTLTIRLDVSQELQTPVRHHANVLSSLKLSIENNIPSNKVANLQYFLEVMTLVCFKHFFCFFYCFVV